MTAPLVARPLSAEAFRPFGDVLEAQGDPDRIINDGHCGRWHDRARIDMAGGPAGLSIFRASPRRFPVSIGLLERHPLGSQAFVPMAAAPFLVVVAPDAGGLPGAPLAFVAGPGQGVNYLRGVWHAVLTPLAPPGLFAVLDRVDEAPNLEEHRLPAPLVVVPDAASGAGLEI
ncbi:MAG: ureidoglycolate lyase [Alphaproteobacteria bacterium]|nr:MAG: ureidoglycolate lyase [Alphaproteobacteria bacterium]